MHWIIYVYVCTETNTVRKRKSLIFCSFFGEQPWFIITAFLISYFYDLFHVFYISLDSVHVVQSDDREQIHRMTSMKFAVLSQSRPYSSMQLQTDTLTGLTLSEQIKQRKYYSFTVAKVQFL